MYASGHAPFTAIACTLVFKISVVSINGYMGNNYTSLTKNIFRLELLCVNYF